jgi:pyrimidine operon attenuation protein/uracil phosphoribosyltransferase
MPRKKVVFSDIEIKKAIETIAANILHKTSNLNEVVLIGVVSAGYPLAQRIAKIINKQKKIELPIGKLDPALYRDDLQNGTKLISLRESDIPVDIDNKYVILVDDVLFHGRTIRASIDMILDYGRPKKIALAVLVDRGHRELPIEANFVGIKLETKISEHIEVKLKEVDGVDEVLLT